MGKYAKWPIQLSNTLSVDLRKCNVNSVKSKVPAKLSVWGPGRENAISN